MKPLKQLCTPRESVFDTDRRDTVLDLTDLTADKIQPGPFFEENYRTGNMGVLFREAFHRFQRRTQQGIFLLTQAMGGGKTHNMIALGLLAKHPEYRKQVMGGDYDETFGLGKVRVVGFTGRESDAPFGIWGAIADQLGKKEQFSDYYSPLSAPGQKAWEKLLKGDPLLILLDELPPYFENAKAKTIGDSNLATVTTTALSNLLVAITKLENVCIVISDLQATYGEGSQQIQTALRNFENEVNRGAMPLEPVSANTSEVYHILRKRLFEDMPAEEEVDEVARGYAKAVRDAKQMDVTNASPDAYAARIKESFPFHFTIRDLYARFRENPGFQQTRGLIRLMRVVVSHLYNSGRADEVHLVHPYDMDLNHKETFAEITSINSTLTNAISHDIADDGSSVAETIDANLGSGRDAQDAATLLLVSSLSSVPDAVKGLTLSEVASYLCAPGRDISKLQKDVLKPFATSAWYLHTTSDGKLFFKNVENLIAKLKNIAGSYNRESQLRELRDFLTGIFEPTLKDCYQSVHALPAIDSISVTSDKVTLVISEPHSHGRLSDELQKFYDQLDYKNRVLFLSGQRDTLERLLEIASELKAVRRIIQEMEAERVSANDPQYQMAKDTLDTKYLSLLSAARETFTTLLYPSFNGQLRSADFLMNFDSNEYNGEKQIRETLKQKRKFTDEVEGATFRKVLEDRLFTQREMPWSEVKKRAAVETRWPWHRTDALDRLKDRMLREEQWEETGGYVNKQPPEPETTVRIQELRRDDDTGEVMLRLSPVHGDTLYYEVGAPATTASERVQDVQKFRTKELEVSFLCVDSAGEHEAGSPVTWENRITLQGRTWQDGAHRKVELRAAPEAPIKYSTDGSNPLHAGGTYDEPFTITEGTRVVLAVAQKNGVASEQYRMDINWEEDKPFELKPELPATWKRSHRLETTKETYEFLNRLERYGAKVAGPRVMVSDGHWVEVMVDPNKAVGGAQLKEVVEHVRGLLEGGDVEIEADELHFDSGQYLQDWVADVKTEIRPEEVEQG